MSYIKIKKIAKEDVDTPEKGYVYFGVDDPTNGPWIKDDDGSDAYYILSGYDSEPTILSINPTNSAYNGDTITINGTNFIPSITSVKFGDKIGLDVNVLSVTQLTVVVPNDITGVISLTISTLYGTSLPVSYTVNYKDSSPIIISISPVLSASIGSNINITGTNFIAGDTVAWFGNGVSGATVVDNSTYLTTTIPDIPIGNTIVFLSSSLGQGNTFNYLVTASTSPTFTSFLPINGNIGDTISLFGTNFSDGEMSVFFGDKYSSDITFHGTTHISAVIADGTPFGNTTIKLGYNTLSGFVVDGSTVSLLPTISSASPLSQGIGNTITLNGTNLDGDITVTFSSIQANVVTNNSTSCSVYINSGTTSGENTIVVINKYGISNNFKYIIPNTINDPIITDFTPDRDYRGRPINLIGSNFILGTGNAVYYGNVLAAKSNGHTSELIKTEISNSSPTGIVDIKIINSNGSYTKSGIEILPINTPPYVSSVSPVFVKENDTINVYGTDLTEGIISFGDSYPGISGETVTMTDIQLQTTLPKILDTAGSNKLINVYVTTVSGTCVFSPLEVYTLPTTSPNILSFSPLNGSVGTLVTITGGFFSKYYTEISVYINNKYYKLDEQEYISNNEVRGFIPNVNGYTGTVFVYVSTSAGTNQKGGFTIS